MSRDSNGNYTLPTGNPVVSDTVIDSVWANQTMADIGATLAASLDRDGKGGMRAPLRVADGTAAAPSLTFTNQTNTGFYRFGDDDLRASVGGADTFRITAGSYISLIGSSDVRFTAGAEFNVAGGVYTFDATGLETFEDELYIGNVAGGRRVLTVGGITATDVAYDNTVVDRIPATNVQAALDILSAGGFEYGSVALTGGGVLTAGTFNRLLDSSVYTLPPASSTQVGTLIGIALPSTATGETPTVNADGADIITWAEGNDTQLQFESPATIQLASNGVDTWEY